MYWSIQKKEALFRIAHISKKLPAKTAGSFTLFFTICQKEKLHLDFYFNAAGQFKLHQSIHGLGGRAVDVDETLVRRNLELFATLRLRVGRGMGPLT